MERKRSYNVIKEKPKPHEESRFQEMGPTKEKKLGKKKQGTKRREACSKSSSKRKKRRESYIIINRKHLSHQVTTRFRY